MYHGSKGVEEYHKDIKVALSRLSKADEWLSKEPTTMLTPTTRVGKGRKGERKAWKGGESQEGEHITPREAFSA
ncbi:hypothetical protein CR513_38048, partial [Mucuna pruriens]